MAGEQGAMYFSVLLEGYHLAVLERDKETPVGGDQAVEYRQGIQPAFCQLAAIRF